MRIVSLADIPSLSEGEVVPGIKCVVKAVFPPRSGESKHGQWTVQNCILKEGLHEVRAAFWGINMDGLKGKEITIVSSAGKKGLDGIKIKNNKGENELSINERCVINDGPNQVVNAPAKSSTSSAATPAAAVDVDGVRVRAMQLANLYLIAHRAAMWVKLENEGIDLPAATATLFIALEKEKMQNVMPKVPLDKAIAEKSKEPKVDKEPLFPEEELEDDVKW